MAELLRQNQDLIFRYCCSQLGDRDQAIEATQETAVRLVGAIARFEGRARLSTWILGIATNVCREFRRQDHKWRQLPEQEEANLVVSSDTRPPPDAGEIQQLNVAIRQLPHRQREAIVLRYYEELSLSEIAGVMQVSVGTVKATISQAKGKLKQHFTRENRS